MKLWEARVVGNYDSSVPKLPQAVPPSRFRWGDTAATTFGRINKKSGGQFCEGIGGADRWIPPVLDSMAAGCVARDLVGDVRVHRLHRHSAEAAGPHFDADAQQGGWRPPPDRHLCLLLQIVGEDKSRGSGRMGSSQ